VQKRKDIHKDEKCLHQSSLTFFEFSSSLLLDYDHHSFKATILMLI